MYMTYGNCGDSGSSRNGNPTADDLDGTVTTTTIVSFGPASTIYGSGSSSGGGNSTTTTTSMPSSPETNTYDPSTISLMTRTTTSAPLTTTESSVSPLMVEEEESFQQPGTLLSSSSISDCGPSPHHRKHHDRNDSYQCTGFSALIQAATSQLEYLAEIASSEYTTQKEGDHNINASHADMDPMVSAVQPKQPRRASFQSAPSSTTALTSTGTMSSATTTPSPTWNDSLPEQLMKLLLSSSSLSSNDTSDMISFLPNGKYFVIRTSILTQFLQKTDHSLFHLEDNPRKDEIEDELVNKENENLAEYEVNDDVTTDTISNHRTTTTTNDSGLSPTNKDQNHSIHTDDWTNHPTPSYRTQSQAVHSRPRRRTRARRTRIRTLHEFVHTLLYRYNFTWIDHRYIQLFSNPLTSCNDDDLDENARNIQPQPQPQNHPTELLPLLSAATSYPEIMVFRHKNFVQDNCCLCQQIPYCDESQSSQEQTSSLLLSPKKEPSSHITTTKLHQLHKNHSKRRQHSKVVHSHHAVVTAQQKPSQEPRSISTSTPEKSIDPSSAIGANAAVTYDEAPSSPLVVGASAMITKRRLSPGFLRQQEQKNGVTTSKQKVKVDISDVSNSATMMVAPVTDESTRTSSFGVDEEYLDSITGTTSTASAIATSMSTTDMVALVDGTSMDNDERKLSSGCESDMTTTTTKTRASVVTSSTTDGRSEMSDTHQESTKDTTVHATSSHIVIPRPIGVMEQTTATMIRNIAISIANERLQLPVPTVTKAASASTKSKHQHENATETTSSLSELVELGITTCTKEIVISAIESLLYHRSHSHEVYQQNLQELSTSSLPNLIPICKHIFENRQYDNSVTTKDDEAIDRPSSLATPSSVTTKTVTPETITTNGVSTEASASSLIRVITTGSDGERTSNKHDGNKDASNHSEKMSPRNLNDDSAVDMSFPQLPKQELLLTTRVGTRRSSAKGNAGTADSN